MRTRRFLLSTAVVVAVGLLPASAARAAQHDVPTRPVTRACALLKSSEIAGVLGVDPGSGRRDRYYCRYTLPEGTALITGLFRRLGSDAIDGARRLAASLGSPPEDVAGLGVDAIWESNKGQLSVATRRGNVFEIQIISAGDPAVTRQQAVDLAGVVLARRRA
jgi:hypothetical protein